MLVENFDLQRRKEKQNERAHKDKTLHKRP